MASHRSAHPARPPAPPVPGDVLRGSPALLADVRQLGARHGVDYTDDEAVGALLARHKEEIHRLRNSPKAWVGGISLLVSVCWPVATLMGIGPPDLALAPRSLVVHAAPALALFVIGLVLVVQSHRRAGRRMDHPELVGYRLVLATATAHRVPVRSAPAWLVGRDKYSDKETHPVPELDLKPRPDTDTDSAAAAVTAPPPPVPEKPYDVVRYESLGTEGGWHDEAGWLLLGAGGIAGVWAYADDQPFGYALIPVLVALGVLVWVAGHRQGVRHRALREAASRYVAEVTAAQRAGAEVPELSPELRKLIV
ncbi:hypothetical protein ACH4SP_24500 [Streptomyces sp. NPDC021093]|uniref:hypothetical protein n=1 Tax=Streptomyces sp. NPDC021093 TaxID=3365112 RepID=UPI0037A3F69D